MMNDILWFPFFAVFGALAFLVAIIVFAFWVWMIVDCAKRKFRTTAEKVLWIVVIVLLSWVGALVYYIVVPLNNPKGIFNNK